MTRTIEVLAAGTGRPCLGDSLDLSQPPVFSVAELMSPAECEQMVARITALGPSAAPIARADNMRGRG